LLLVPDTVASTRRVFLAAAMLALPLAALPARSSSWTALHFSTGPSFNHTLAVGDLNSDGLLDVATANSQTSAVTVLLGTGGGALAGYTAYPTFTEPQDVQMADLTGDGILDLATPDYVGGGVTVLRGLGNGTFAARVGYPVGPGLISLAVVDLNGDSRRDLAVAKESGNKLAVLPALAAGGFGTALEVATGSIPHQIGTADFNHDGHADLAIASHGAGTVSLHMGNGTHQPGAATPFAAGSAPIGLTISDLDQDGDPDLVVSNVNSATVSVLLGNGNGTFAPPVAYPASARPRGMDAGDLDGDGVPEVVVATGYPDGDSVLTVLRGVGDGTLTLLAHLDLPYRAADCVVADMNGDGRRDIVVTGPLAGVVSVLLNPGTLGVPASGGAISGLELRAHPNPSRAAFTFRYRAPAGARTMLDILEPSGRRIASLPSESGNADWRSATWDGVRANGDRAAPGVYFVRLSAGTGSVVRRLVLLAR
jgi:hypothetical protein